MGCSDNVILLTPLSLYLWMRCCESTDHITNLKKPSSANDIGKALMEMSISLRNMIIMGKLRDITILYLSDALGIIPGRGSDPVGENWIIDLWVMFWSTCQQMPTNCWQKKWLRKSPSFWSLPATLLSLSTSRRSSKFPLTPPCSSWHLTAVRNMDEDRELFTIPCSSYGIVEWGKYEL
jgi:hypothetical protein